MNAECVCQTASNAPEIIGCIVLGVFLLIFLSIIIPFAVAIWRDLFNGRL